MEWWSMTPTEVLKNADGGTDGIKRNEAQKRLETDGRNRTEQGEGKRASSGGFWRSLMIL